MAYSSVVYYLFHLRSVTYFSYFHVSIMQVCNELGGGVSKLHQACNVAPMSHMARTHFQSSEISEAMALLCICSMKKILLLIYHFILEYIEASYRHQGL